MSLFLVASVVAALLTVVVARLFRSRWYALFRAVAFTIYVPLASVMWSVFSDTILWPLYIYLHAAVFVRSLLLVRPRLRSLPYRALISLPSAFFSAATVLALPWAIAVLLGKTPPALWLPYLIGGFGLFQSLTSRRSNVDIALVDLPAAEPSGKPRRARSGDFRSDRPLRIVQITDPHLGPFMSVKRLRRICERAVQKQPDLVFLTGDFLTMESQSDADALGAALEPLNAYRGRVFACFGNHDHEAPLTVRSALAKVGAQLLIDDAVEVDTGSGRVQVLGIDYVWGNRADHVARVCRAFPRAPDQVRIVLLHDPGCFRFVPDGLADLTLSGHTHGGQVGFVSLGLHHTMLRVIMNAPDHGLWRRGSNLLYVHRGTGHYGFPLRIGVPAEESVLYLHFRKFAGREPVAA